MGHVQRDSPALMMAIAGVVFTRDRAALYKKVVDYARTYKDRRIKNTQFLAQDDAEVMKQLVTKPVYIKNCTSPLEKRMATRLNTALYPVLDQDYRHEYVHMYDPDTLTYDDKHIFLHMDIEGVKEGYATRKYQEDGKAVEEPHEGYKEMIVSPVTKATYGTTGELKYHLDMGSLGLPTYDEELCAINIQANAEEMKKTVHWYRMMRTRYVDNWGYRTLGWNVTKTERAERAKRLAALEYAKSVTARHIEDFILSDATRESARAEATVTKVYENLMKNPDRVLTEQEERMAKELREEEVMEAYEQLTIAQRVNLARELPAEFVYVEDLDLPVDESTKELTKEARALEKITLPTEAVHIRGKAVILKEKKEKDQRGQEVVTARIVQEIETGQ